MALLVDISNIPECACDGALEHLHKALNDEDGLAHDIWAEHESPFIRALIEAFTKRGLFKIAKVQDELKKWLAGDYYVPAVKYVPVPAGHMGRWTQAELDLVNVYLQNIPPDSMTLDDWSMLIDYTVQRYLPVDQLNEEAEWLAVKSGMMGKVQAHMGDIDIATAATIVEALPATAVEAAMMFNLPPAAEAIMEYGKIYGCENVQAVTESFRYKLKKVILNHESAKLLGDASSSPQSLEQALFDTFSSANRDWRRIALTEAGEMANQGVIASLPAGSKVRRMEMYRGACPFCKKIDGRIFSVVDPSSEDKDGTKEVWVGKTNIGRSSSPRKRSGDELVERLPSELWWVGAGVMHPHCFINPRVLIYTVQGYKPISDIKVGDLVLTHKGRFKPVNWVLSGKKHTGNVIGLTLGTKNKKRMPFTTPEHPYLTSRGWIKSGDIVVGDRIVALSKICQGCGKPFVNLKHPNVNNCGKSCVEPSGSNQFSEPDTRDEARQVTSEANKKRMRLMTVEQRRDLTKKARISAKEKGYEWLRSDDVKKRSAISNANKNYTPSGIELSIHRELLELGVEPTLQHRVLSGMKDISGRVRYWWLDIALTEQKIAIEIDGAAWHRRGEFISRDDRRDNDLTSMGWTVMRFDHELAKANPSFIAQEIARLAMNHSGDYVFSDIEVTDICEKEVANKRLYNFGVEDDESYIIGGGIVVHNCRGQWVVMDTSALGSDPEFASFLSNLFGHQEGL